MRLLQSISTACACLVIAACATISPAATTPSAPSPPPQLSDGRTGNVSDLSVAIVSKNAVVFVATLRATANCPPRALCAASYLPLTVHLRGCRIRTEGDARFAVHLAEPADDRDGWIGWYNAGRGAATPSADLRAVGRCSKVTP
jgi:hypothetical protein